KAEGEERGSWNNLRRPAIERLDDASRSPLSLSASSSIKERGGEGGGSTSTADGTPPHPPSHSSSSMAMAFLASFPSPAGLGLGTGRLPAPGHGGLVLCGGGRRSPPRAVVLLVPSSTTFRGIFPPLVARASSAYISSPAPLLRPIRPISPWILLVVDWDCVVTEHHVQADLQLQLVVWDTWELQAVEEFCRMLKKSPASKSAEWAVKSFPGSSGESAAEEEDTV
ncbi:hypothetical protein U9M48_021244, partial [Paspalum notatum var. saurae]